MSQHYQLIHAIDITNIPYRCGCSNSKRPTPHGSCINSVRNVYRFQDGTLKYSCNMKAHMQCILSSMTTNDVVDVYTRKTSTSKQFTLSIANFNCFQVFNSYPNLTDMFHGPFTQSDASKVSIREKQGKSKAFMLSWCNDSSHKECTICLTNVSKKNGGHVDCGHAFHNKCLKPWIQMKKKSCPTCRSHISPDKFIV